MEIPNTYESLYNPGDWVPGVHGLAMRFTDNIGSVYSGQIMPVDNKEDIEPLDMCKMLMSKAGYKGFVTNAMIRTAVFMRFTMTKTEMR